MNIPNGRYTLTFTVDVLNGEPDDADEIEIRSDSSILDSTMYVDEFLEHVDPKQLKEIAAKRKQELLEELDELNKTLEENDE